LLRCVAFVECHMVSVTHEPFMLIAVVLIAVVLIAVVLIAVVLNVVAP